MKSFVGWVLFMLMMPLVVPRVVDSQETTAMRLSSKQFAIDQFEAPKPKDETKPQPQTPPKAQPAAEPSPVPAAAQKRITTPSAEQRTEVAAAPQTTTPGNTPRKTWTEPATEMEFVWVAGGCYEMGCGAWAGGFCLTGEEPMHKVCVDGFWIGKYEVTQGQWEKVMGSDPPGRKKGSNYPVTSVSWDEAKVFIRKLEGLSGGRSSFRLPSEAEWEYACRSGGKKESFAGGENVDRVAWFIENSKVSTHGVGTKAPNGLGIYDMSGNVEEWCEDIYSEYAYGKHEVKNPVNTTSRGQWRVIRGGSCYEVQLLVRCTTRGLFLPGSGNTNLGFRLVRTP